MILIMAAFGSTIVGTIVALFEPARHWIAGGARSRLPRLSYVASGSPSAMECCADVRGLARPLLSGPVRGRVRPVGSPLPPAPGGVRALAASTVSQAGNATDPFPQRPPTGCQPVTLRRVAHSHMRSDDS